MNEEVRREAGCRVLSENLCSAVDGRKLTYLVLEVRVRTKAAEKLHHIRVSVSGCHMKGCLSRLQKKTRTQNHSRDHAFHLFPRDEGQDLRSGGP